MARSAPIRRHHVHWPGVFAIALTTFVGIGAINSQNNLMFLVFGIALSLIALSGIISGAMLMRVRVSRSHVAFSHAGQTGTIDYAITNAGRFLPAFALLVREIPPQRPRRRRKRRPAPPSLPAAIATVLPRSAVRARAQTVPRGRGIVPLSGVEVSTSFPLGVFRKSVRFADRGELIIAPALRRVAPSELGALLAADRSGFQTSDAHSGHGLDFYGLRDYVPGDSMRKLGWKAWARTDQLVVHQTADEPSRALHLVLAIDAADGADACEVAISECASVAIAAAAAGIDVEVSVAGRDLRARVRGPHGRADLLRALARLEVEFAGHTTGHTSRHASSQVVIASGSNGRALAPAGRVWGQGR